MNIISSIVNWFQNNTLPVSIAKSPVHEGFEIPDIAQKIFSSLLSPYYDRHSSGLRNVEMVSKNFNIQALTVKKEWVQTHLISLKIYSLKSADDVVNHILVNKPFTGINLRHFPDFNEKHLKELVDKNQKICSLKINCEVIKEWPKMDSLTEILHLDKCNDKDLAVIAEASPNLHTIDLGNSQITDKGLIMLTELCPNIQIITLQNVRGITDTGLIKLGKSCLKLHTIDLSYTKITDTGLIAFAKSTPNLEVICLGGLLDVTDAGLSELAKACPQLRFITLDGTHLSAAGLTELAKTCRKLETVYFTERRVTPNVLASLRKDYPHINFRAF